MRRIMCVLFVLLFLTGCEQDIMNTVPNQETHEPAPSAAPASGGEINVYAMRPDTFNPLQTTFAANRDLLSLVFEGLFEISSSGEEIPLLAQSYEITDGGTRIVVQLRSGVTWHDGTSFSAQDVDYTVQTILSLGDESYYIKNLEHVKSSRPIGSMSYEFVLSKPDAGFIGLLNFPIIKRSSAREGTEFDPIGTGKYVYESYNYLKSIILVKNQSYYGQIPYIDRINAVVLPDNESVYNAFGMNTIDLSKSQQSDAGRYMINDKIQSAPVYTNKYTFLGINFGNKLLIDPALREILYYAIDRNRIIANLLGDFAVVTTCPINPAFLEQDSIEQGTDVKMLLAQNGYGNVNESGTRVKEIDGERIPLQFDLVVCGDGSIKGTVAEYIQNSLASFGIDIRIKNVPYEEYLSRVEEGDFDLFLGEIDLSADYDMERLLKTGGTLNYGEFQDEAMDAVIDQMNSAQSLHQLKEKRKEFEQIFREKLPQIPLYFGTDRIMYDSQAVQGVGSQVIGKIYGSIENWYVPQ